MQAAIWIRRAEEDDALELSVLAERTFRAAFAESNTAANMQLHCATAYGHALQLAEIRESGRETWVAEADARLVAYVQLRFDATSPMISGERPVEIQRFYVDASHHAAGLAHHSWRTLLREPRPPDPRCYGSECGNEIPGHWPFIENGGLMLWRSISSRSATILNAT
jgi:hypothetical protein